MEHIKEYFKKLFKNCDNVNDIQNINDMFNYEDNRGGGGSLEWDLISCGQDGSKSGYNELERFFNEHISQNLKNRKKEILKYMCECCKEIEHSQRTHNAFRECMDKKIQILKLIASLKENRNY